MQVTSIDNALFVVMELFESSRYSVTLATIDSTRLCEIAEVQQHTDCSNYVRWCGSCNHTLSLPCDLFQICDAGGEMPVVCDGLENRESKVNFSWSNSAYTPSHIMVVEKLGKDMQNFRREEISRIR